MTHRATPLTLRLVIVALLSTGGATFASAHSGDGSIRPTLSERGLAAKAPVRLAERSHSPRRAAGPASRDDQQKGEATAKDGAPAKPSAGTDANGIHEVWTAGSLGERDCPKKRRKLWRQGVGWVVKTLTVCP